MPPLQVPQGQQRKPSQQLLCTGPSRCQSQSKLAQRAETKAGRSSFGRENRFSLSKKRREEYKHSTTKTRDPSLLRGIHFTGENTTAECHSLGHPPTHPPSPIPHFLPLPAAGGTQVLPGTLSHWIPAACSSLPAASSSWRQSVRSATESVETHRGEARREKEWPSRFPRFPEVIAGHRASPWFFLQVPRPSLCSMD